MNVDEVEDVLRRVRYKPGFEIGVLRDAGPRMPWPTHHLIMRTYAPDAHDQRTNARRPIPITMTVPLPPLGDCNEMRLLEFVRYALGTFEMHERDEFIQYEGMRIFDPHALEAKNREQMKPGLMSSAFDKVVL